MATDLADLPDDIADTLSGPDAIALASAIQALERMRKYQALAGTFPITESWPPDYPQILDWRRIVAARLEAEPDLALGAKAYYRHHIADFIDHWCVTYDPRKASMTGPNGERLPTKMPFIQFQRQRELIAFLLACIEAEESGLAEKSRDMGATWGACGFSVGLWLFWPGAAVGWGSRKEQLVDKIGDPDSIFEKMRMIVRNLPKPLLPAGFDPNDHMAYMKFINPETGATITGEAGDNIGRGGRKLIYFKDESAHYERPEKIEAALADNTRVQIDISSVNGFGNVFQRRRDAGEEWAPGRSITPGRTAVFIMDWTHHPEKTQEWYDRRRKKAVDDGLLHVFKQEVDRDYSGAVEGTIIPAEWVKSAIGARIRLGLPDRGAWRVALDVADGGGDTNALAKAKGIEVKDVDQWGAPDTGVTARKAVEACRPLGFVNLQYDSVGVGSGVKAEANRLEAEGRLPDGLHLVPWNGGAKVIEPDEPVIPGDMDSPLNADHFYNLKAQAWWRLRERFYKTHRAIEALAEGADEFTYDPDELISLDPTMPLLHQLVKELSQPTATKDTRTNKLVVNKTPEGTKSPNLADSVVMAFTPLPGLAPVYPVAPSEIEQVPFKVPDHWPRAFAMRVEPNRVTAMWGAYDELGDVLYLTAEHQRNHAEPSANAVAIATRGKWIPGFVETGSNVQEEIRMTLATYEMQGLRVFSAERRAVDAGVSDMLQRITTGRLKVFATCTEFFKGYRAYRRDPEGSLIGGGLVDCARILCRPTTIPLMIVKPADKMLAVKRRPNIYR